MKKKRIAKLERRIDELESNITELRALVNVLIRNQPTPYNQPYTEPLPRYLVPLPWQSPVICSTGEYEVTH